MKACVKCGNHSFQVEHDSPYQSKFKFLFVTCSSCGGVAGVMDYFNLGTLLNQQDKKIDALASQLTRIEMLLTQIATRR